VEEVKGEQVSAGVGDFGLGGGGFWIGLWYACQGVWFEIGFEKDIISSANVAPNAKSLSASDRRAFLPTVYIQTNCWHM